MTPRELIQRAVEIAIQGVPGIDRAAAEIAAEPLLLIVFGEVGRELAASDRTRHILRRVKTLDVVDGEVAIPDDVLTEYTCEATLYDPADVAKRYSLATWSDFINGVLDSRLGHFIINEGVLTVVEPDSQWEPTAGPTLTVHLAIPCAPEVPAIDTEIAVPAEITDMIVDRLVRALKPTLVTTRR